MDWPSNDPPFTKEDKNAFFMYLDGNSVAALRLYGTENSATPLWQLDSDKKWEDWLSEDHFLLRRGSQPGLGLLLLARAEEPQRNPGVLARLPFSWDVFQDLAEALPLHRNTIKTIKSPRFAMFVDIDLRETKWNAIFYCGRTSCLHIGDMAVSSVFYPDTGFTAATVFGCSQSAIEDILGRLDAAADSITHPLLIIGIVVELEYKRHDDLVRDQVTKLIQRVLDLSNLEEISTTSKVRKDYYSVGAWIDVNQLRSDLQTWKVQLDRMIEHIDQLNDTFEMKITSPTSSCSVGSADPGWRQQAAITGRRLKKRLKEIIHDYDKNIRECNMALEGLALATQMSWNQISYQDTQTNLRIASDAKYDSSHMKIIATMTMVFLPATFVSSVFSMSFFDWDPPEGKQIVSHYAWIYPVIVAVITIIVVGVWYPFTRRVKAKHSYIPPSVSDV
ncbi:hypothetical protein GE09DRAFT_1099696 [Coniochaeta sp. 2T2.1]|nr:hypothetical protein GE09DRAFT_1099696 [Coniochaeta sp. 2T2.1]